MKARTCSLVVATLLQLAAAQPHGRHARFPQKRGQVYTQVEWVTQTVDDTIVYVDENGAPFSTAYERTAPTPAIVNIPAAEQPVHVVATPSPAAAPADRDIPAAVRYPHPAPSPVPPPAPAVEAPVYPVEFTERYASAAAGVSRSDGYGISWAPFQGEETAVTCKPQEQVDEEFSKIARLQFTSVRVYGTVCDQVSLAMRAAAANGLRVMLGVFDLGNVVGETNDLIRQVRETGLGWNMVDTVSIGNEDVQKGAASADAVIAAVNSARSILRSAGYQGPIVHVETHGAILANPQLCSDAAGDYIAANIHPFFNPLTLPNFAGKYVKSQVRALQECSARQSRKRSEHRVVVTETGWPTGGSPNGLAVPGRGQQFAAIKSIKKELENDVYLFSAFDNRWQKDSSGTFGAEKHWGLLVD